MNTVKADGQSESAALLFTNNLGQVVFVDEKFLNMMHYSEAGVVTGEPLFKALRLDQSTAKRLLESLLKAGQVKDEVLQITDPTRQKGIQIAFTGVASFDATGTFIGADIMLRDVTAPAPTDNHEVQQIAAQPAREVIAEAVPDENDMFVQLYVTTHIKALYVLLGRLVGLKMQDHLDKAINEVGQRNGKAIHIKAGLFTSELAGTDRQTYRQILRAAGAYAVNIIGRGVVAKEMQRADAQLHQGVLVLAAQAGLRDFLS